MTEHHDELTRRIQRNAKILNEGFNTEMGGLAKTSWEEETAKIFWERVLDFKEKYDQMDSGMVGKPELLNRLVDLMTIVDQIIDRLDASGDSKTGVSISTLIDSTYEFTQPLEKMEEIFNLLAGHANRKPNPAQKKAPSSRGVQPGITPGPRRD